MAGGCTKVAVQAQCIVVLSAILPSPGEDRDWTPLARTTMIAGFSGPGPRAGKPKRQNCDGPHRSREVPAMQACSLFSTRLDISGLCLIAALAAACSSNPIHPVDSARSAPDGAGGLLPEAGAAGSGGTSVNPPDLQSPQTAAAASAATHLTLPSPQAAAVEPAATHLTLQSPQTAAAASAATHLTLPSPQAAAVEPAATHLTLPPPQAAVGARLERAGVQVEPAGSRQRRYGLLWRSSCGRKLRRRCKYCRRWRRKWRQRRHRGVRYLLYRFQRRSRRQHESQIQPQELRKWRAGLRRGMR